MAIIKVSIQNSEEVSVNVRTFLKGDPGQTIPYKKLLFKYVGQTQNIYIYEDTIGIPFTAAPMINSVVFAINFSSPLSPDLHKIDAIAHMSWFSSAGYRPDWSNNQEIQIQTSNFWGGLDPDITVEVRVYDGYTLVTPIYF